MICFRNPAMPLNPVVVMVNEVDDGQVQVGWVEEDEACEKTMLKGRRRVMGTGKKDECSD